MNLVEKSWQSLLYWAKIYAYRELGKKVLQWYKEVCSPQKPYFDECRTYLFDS